MAERIPTNLITGFLGVGKTTAILDLLKRKPAEEPWAVLVNEYGAVSIDDALLEGSLPESGVAIRSVAGGCFCCTTAPMMPVALHFLLQEVAPARLLIETSGLGHPARIVDTVRQHYADRLDLRATIGILTPSDFRAPGMIDSNPIFRDQIVLSDVLVLNKAETADSACLADVQAWANGLFPPKWLVAATTGGRLDPAWLDHDHSHERRARVPDEHLAHGDDTPLSLDRPLPGRPLRFPSPDGASCGWIFHPDDLFDGEKLTLLWTESPELSRFKGLFRLPQGWMAFNRAGGQVSESPSAYRRDSRLEAFGTGVDWVAFEERLLKCRK